MSALAHELEHARQEVAGETLHPLNSTKEAFIENRLQAERKAELFSHKVAFELSQRGWNNARVAKETAKYGFREQAGAYFKHRDNGYSHEKAAEITLELWDASPNKKAYERHFAEEYERVRELSRQRAKGPTLGM
jgi:hypothetical protein